MTRVPPIEQRFKKGTSGNPYGRPRITERDVFILTTALFELLIKYKNKDRTVQDRLKRIKEILDET
ncbi:hypothetical protein Dip510_001449 [Elusimicrobium posterum]|uniref:DUF5681 domain-containing protein n=1 Tax=Elusimicrobium posterum TaxID=3116653 RepID=UPI003C75838B